MFEELVKTDPERVRQLALHNLQSAGIVDENENLASVYAGDSVADTPSTSAQLHRGLNEPGQVVAEG